MSGAGGRLDRRRRGLACGRKGALLGRYQPVSSSIATSPEAEATRTWFFDRPPTALALTDRADTLVVALGGGLILWQPANDARADFAHPEDNWPQRPAERRRAPTRPEISGSARCTTMSARPAKDTADRRHRGGTPVPHRRPTDAVTVVKTGIGISNTFCWSPDATLFYTGDTLTGTISAWDYDAATGTIANERPFFGGFERGAPDGSAVDSDGYLWNARYGGGCVVRVSPAGAIDRIVEMPVDNVTTCAFGGPDLTTLYITTATGGSRPDLRFAGGLFALRGRRPGTGGEPLSDVGTLRSCRAVIASRIVQAGSGGRHEAAALPCQLRRALPPR